MKTINSFNYYMPVKIFFGQNCITENASAFKTFGKKALLVTGKTSAKVNGSQKNVCDALNSCGISCEIFDNVECNPSVENVRKGAKAARSSQADFIVGIGGGSPMDAAKAIAVLAKNDLDDESLFDKNINQTALPVIAVPTTAGTGSEVTPYSIITDPKIGNKRNLSSENIFPRIAFLDPLYTASMPYNTTAGTALDALSHAVEGFLSTRATPPSRLFSIESIKILGKCLPHLQKGRDTDPAVRTQLQYASLLAGIVISQTGTTVVHPMGYALTIHKNIDHGRANGLLMHAYLEFISGKQKDKVAAVLGAFGMDDLNSFRDLMDRLLGKKETLDDHEIKTYSSVVLQAKSAACTIPAPALTDIEMIYRKSLK